MEIHCKRKYLNEELGNSSDEENSDGKNTIDSYESDKRQFSFNKHSKSVYYVNYSFTSSHMVWFTQNSHSNQNSCNSRKFFATLDKFLQR